MTCCCFCGFEPKGPASLTEMADGRTRCKSGTACLGRLRSGKHLKRPVRLALEDPPVVHKDPDRIAREVRNAYYRSGLCIDCGIRHHSPGRTRCEQCHRART